MYVIRERVLALGDDFDITDSSGQVVLHVDGKVLSLRNRLLIQDPDGREVASVHRHLVALRPTYEIRIGDEPAAEVRKHIFTPLRDRFTIDVPGPDDLEVAGDLLDHEFRISRSGREVASVSKRWLSLHDSYAVRIADGEDHLLILASVLAVDLALAREESEQ
jgi:uncharacterized protein YxjI